MSHASPTPGESVGHPPSGRIYRFRENVACSDHDKARAVSLDRTDHHFGQRNQFGNTTATRREISHGLFSVRCFDLGRRGNPRQRPYPARQDRVSSCKRILRLHAPQSARGKEYAGPALVCSLKNRRIAVKIERRVPHRFSTRSCAAFCASERLSKKGGLVK